MEHPAKLGFLAMTQPPVRLDRDPLGASQRRDARSIRRSAHVDGPFERKGFDSTFIASPTAAASTPLASTLTPSMTGAPGAGPPGSGCHAEAKAPAAPCASWVSNQPELPAGLACLRHAARENARTAADGHAPTGRSRRRPTRGGVRRAHPGDLRGHRDAECPPVAHSAPAPSASHVSDSRLRPRRRPRGSGQLDGAEGRSCAAPRPWRPRDRREWRRCRRR